MKNIIIESKDSQHDIITLVRREGIKLTNFSLDELIVLLMMDVDKAAYIYQEEVVKEIDNQYKKEWDDSLETRIKKAREQALYEAERRKLKTQRGKDKAMQKAEDLERSKKHVPFEHQITFFDLGKLTSCQYCNSLSIWSSLGSNKDQLKSWYEDYKGYARMLHIIGWELKYETYKGNLISNGRPYIEWIFDDESISKEIELEQERLSRSIENFYSGTDYWGD